MPNIKFRCESCGREALRFHNCKKCLRCGGRLVPLTPTGSCTERDHRAMEFIRQSVVLEVAKFPVPAKRGMQYAALAMDGSIGRADDPADAVILAATKGKS